MTTANNVYPMIEDAELLRRYAEEGSEAAFAELVRRRVNLVYSVALRQVGGDAHLAHDVTQRVFADLARKAPQLAQRPVLSGWLCRSAQFAGSDVVRAERRRRAREQESQAMQETSTEPAGEPNWNRVRPLLDEALSELNEYDRDAVALRFFEGRAFAEIGERLRLSEDTARKRVERALDKLAVHLSRRGVKSTAGALGIALAGHASMAAPAGLANAVTTVSLAVGKFSALAPAGATLAGTSLGVKLGFGAMAAATVLASGLAWMSVREAHEERTAHEGAVAAQKMAQAKAVELQARLLAEEKRARAAEDDNATLLAAIQTTRNGLLANAGVRTAAELAREEAETRYKRAHDRMREGQWAGALADLLWCYDEGMTVASGHSGTRLGTLLTDVLKVAEHLPAARTALRERRDRAEHRLLGDVSDERAAHDLASLNRVLDEGARTLDVYDRLSNEDPRKRRLLLAGTYSLLVDARRYSDALVAVPYERMGAWMDRESRPPSVANEAYPEMTLRRHRRAVVTDAAKNVEVLAGAGDLGRAREFATRILAFDSSAETRELLQRHAARAGQPALLESVAGR